MSPLLSKDSRILFTELFSSSIYSCIFSCKITTAILNHFICSANAFLHFAKKKKNLSLNTFLALTGFICDLSESGSWLLHLWYLLLIPKFSLVPSHPHSPLPPLYTMHILNNKHGIYIFWTSPCKGSATCFFKF